MIERVKSVFLVSLLVLLSACSSTQEKDKTFVPGSQAQPVDAASTSGYQNGDGISGSKFGASERDLTPAELGAAFTDPNNPLSKQTIYFMYDSSMVQQDFISVIAAHAQYLAANPGQRLVLEGHADERGSREYNIALGEQRSKAVARMMQVQGVSAAQLELVSYGEEKPDDEGHNEAAWQMNRRVELIYQGK